MTTICQLSLPDVIPDQVCRDLYRVNASINWDDDPTRLTAHVGDCRIELFADPTAVLLITGSTNDAVRDAAGRLGHHDVDDSVTEVTDEVSAR
jgi:hypothetical protein